MSDRSKTTRRGVRFGAAALAVAGLLCGMPAARADPVSQSAGASAGEPAGMETARLQPARATERGLAWLTQAQQPDGSWGSGRFRGSAAVTAQVVMAFVASGSTPASGPHAAAVARGVSFLEECAGLDGLIAGREQAAHGPMYAHAFATTALAEVFGETDEDARLAGILVAARDLIERTQNDAGGWRYQPVRRDADLSVTAAMLVALRSLHDGGFAVSEEAVTRACGYLCELQNPDGGFRYMDTPGPSAAPRTAAAVFALLLAGRRVDPAIERGFGWLDANPVKLGGADGYALYGLGYEAAARWRLRGAEGDRDRWQAGAAGQLLPTQRADGSWEDPSCPEYGTAAAVSVLCTPRGLLPLFQDDADAARGTEAAP